MSDEALPAIERDPRFKTWEAERTWLVAREHELVAEREDVDADAEQAAYDVAAGDGFEDDYCQAMADKVATRRKEIKKAMHEIRVRLTLIGPMLRQEKAALHAPAGQGVKQQRWERSQEGHNRHVESQERIASALERIANALESGACQKSRRLTATE